MPQLPAPLRAAIGAIATVVEERHTLPDKALQFPVLAVSTALQISLRAQQRYAALTAKGDEVLGQRHGTPEEPPAWAIFDDPPEPPPAHPAPAQPASAQPNAAAARPVTKSTPARKATSAKKVPAPRASAPSRFDLVAQDQPAEDQPTDHGPDQLRDVTG
jgi:hypothetical protein